MKKIISYSSALLNSTAGSWTINQPTNPSVLSLAGLIIAAIGLIGSIAALNIAGLLVALFGFVNITSYNIDGTLYRYNITALSRESTGNRTHSEIGEVYHGNVSVNNDEPVANNTVYGSIHPHFIQTQNTSIALLFWSYFLDGPASVYTWY